MKLYAFRHGIAIDRDDPGCPPDAQRYLTDKGKRRTRAAAAGFKALGIRPRHIFTSPWLRAQQTANIVAKTLDTAAPIETEALLPDQVPGLIIQELISYELASDDQVMVVGHAPHLDFLIAHLIGAEQPVTELKKAGLAEVAFERLAPWSGTLVAVYPPRALRMLA